MRRRITARRLLAAATGFFAGAAAGPLAWDQDFASLVAIPVIAVALFAGVRLIVPKERRFTLSSLILLAYALRAAVAVILYQGSLSAGRNGFITGDDSDYAVVAWGIVRYLSGSPQPPWVPPFWNGYTHILGTWVYLESALFWFFGPNVPLAEILNAGFGSAAIILIYSIAHRLLRETEALAAAAIVAFYPSLVLWSGLNLKDALSLFFIALVLWLLVRFQARPAFWVLLGAYVLLFPMESLRRYIFAGFAILIPATVALSPRLRPWQRGAWGVIAVAMSFGLFQMSEHNTSTVQLISPSPGTLQTLERSRQAMSVGARTGFQDLPPLRANEGDTFVVTRFSSNTGQSPSASPASPATVAGTQPSPSPLASADPNQVAVAGGSSVGTGSSSQGEAVPPANRVVYVPPGSHVVVALATAGLDASAAAPEPSLNPDVVVVRPGDLVIFGAPGTSPAPPAQRRTLALQPETKPTIRLAPAIEPTEAAVPRTAAYLPRGLAYALFSPFPWAIERSLDFLTVPEMLFWYLMLAVLPWSLWRDRTRWAQFAPLAMYVAGMLLILALAEGNYGTLFRHRGMIIPVAIVLAAPGLVALWRSLRGRLSALALGSGPGGDPTR